MKYYLIAITFFTISLVNTKLTAQKESNILTATIPYDSIDNFIKGDPARYVGQELWLKGLPKNHQQFGYANFVTNFKKFDNLNEGKNVYKCCDGYNSKYEDLVDKHFYVEMAFTHERKDKVTQEKVTDTFLKLIELSSGDGLYYYFEPTMSEFSFPFVVMGYLEKQRMLLQGSQFVFTEEITLNSNDMNTGKAVNPELGCVWNYVDITVTPQSNELCLIAKNKNGQQIAVPMQYIEDTTLPKKVYSAQEAKSMKNRFGEFNYARILQQKIASNMNKDALKLSWGEPIEILENGSGNKKTETWIYTMGTVTFRGNTIIKID